MTKEEKAGGNFILKHFLKNSEVSLKLMNSLCQVQKQAWSWLLWGSRSRMKTSRRLRMLTRSCRLPGFMHKLQRLLRLTLLKQVTIHNHYTSGHSIDLQIVLSRYPFRIQWRAGSCGRIIQIRKGIQSWSYQRWSYGKSCYYGQFLNIA